MPLLRYFAWLAPALLSTVATHAAPAPLFPNTSAVDEAALSSYSRSNRNCRPGEPRLEWTSMDLSRERWCRRKRARKPSPWHRRSVLECVKVVPSTMLGALSRLRCPPPLTPLPPGVVRPAAGGAAAVRSSLRPLRDADRGPQRVHLVQDHAQ